MDQNPFIGRRAFGILAVGCLVASALPRVAVAQMDKVHASMAALKGKAAKLGPPKIEGTDTVAGKDVPALYFGTTKMNNNFDVVDEVVKENGGVATFFVKAGDEYVRIATNVKKADGSRAIGTILDPNGPVIAAIRKGAAYYGDAMILGKPYVTGYDPIRGASGNVIGIYFVGYLKG
ncbi:MAG TPA: Cache 3/Cache 2 fusion domain-containing protein [Acidocella sp.]|nr:Cache 3/Cache 2 fusion domain-containing protein [Acidocella sp.]